MRQGLKQTAILLALILFQLYLVITSLFRNSIRNISVVKFNLLSLPIIVLRCYFLSVTFWSSMSSLKRWKGTTGSLRPQKNFLMRLAIRCGLVIVSIYSQFLLLSYAKVYSYSSTATLFLKIPYTHRPYGLLVKQKTSTYKITGIPISPTSQFSIRLTYFYINAVIAFSNSNFQNLIDSVRFCP